MTEGEAVSRARELWRAVEFLRGVPAAELTRDDVAALELAVDRFGVLCEFVAALRAGASEDEATLMAAREVIC